jgi:hypothetical protein
MDEQACGVVLAQQHEQALAVSLGDKRPRTAGAGWTGWTAGAGGAAGSGHGYWADRTTTAVP